MGLFKNKNKQDTYESTLEVSKNKEGETITFFLKGKLDSTTAHELDEEIAKAVKQAKKLIFNLSHLTYISSAGLRSFLAASRQLDGKGEILITNPNKEVNDIFIATGFADVFNIE